MYSRVNFFRFYLAASVVFYHLLNDFFPQSGTMAVLGFFFVSGFLITDLLNGKYKSRASAFVINRCIRIYPAYIATLFVGVWTVYTFPDLSKNINPVMIFPENVSGWLENAYIWGLQGNRERLVPPAWSLDIELRWYAVFLMFGVLGSAIRTKLFYIMLPIPIGYIWFELNFYGGFFGSAFAFCLGALYWYKKPKINYNLELILVFFIPFVMFFLPFVLGLKGVGKTLVGQLNLFCFPFLLYFSFGFFLRGEEKKYSELLGGLSYPIFLLHWYGAVLASAYFGVEKIQ